MAKKLLSVLMCVLLLASSAIIVSAADTDTSSSSESNAYTAASQEIDDKYGYNEDDLGATYTPEATTFKVWSPTASEVSLNLYATGSDSEEGAEDLGTYPMEMVYSDDNNFTGVWSIVIEEDLKNVYYTYSITTTNVTGTMEETTKETQDVYSVATGVNGNRSMVCDLDSTDPEGWENDSHVVLDKSTDSSVWEIHIKDFSYDENSGVSDANRGKYLAFTETGTTLNGEGNTATCIDYLKELGITTVQINPFYDFGSVDETGSDTQFNWGYDPVNYNVPEGSYSSNPYDGNTRITECKQMIMALHEAGISVVMDVVYNHTYSYDSCFEATVPNYYYRMTADGSYSNGSGCGNETASERLMYRNYVIQSCLYWVNEYHVDGFRFDLMGCMDAETMNLIRDALDGVNANLTIWGEGWTGGTCTYPDTTCTGETFVAGTQANSSSLNERVAFFNDQIRDGLKGSVFTSDGQGWIQGAKSSYSSIYAGLFANSKGGSWTATSPQQCVSYASCHDNATLWDRLCNSNYLTDYYRSRNDKLISENKLSAGVLTMSQGITFMLAGEEMCRSKDGDENSYSSSATENMIDWSLVESNADVVSYYKGLLKIRQNFAPLTDNTNDSSANYLVYSGTTNSSTLAYVISNTTEGQWNKLAVLANNTGSDVEYTLADTTKDWVIIANDEEAGLTSLGTVSSGKFTIPARSMVIAVDKTSFESVNVPNTLGKVTVTSINVNTNEVIDSHVIKGTIGSTYSAAAPTSLGKEYVQTSVEGSPTGTYSTEDQSVTYYFGYYVPESLDNDLNGSGKLDINDATLLQRYAANMATLTDDQIAIADYNYDGAIDINDVTMIQKNLAGMSVGTGTVTVNFYQTGTTDSVASSIEYTGLVGETYTSTTATALGYVLDESTLPEETVTIAFGVTKEINYYYDYVRADVNIYVKHSSGDGYDPYIWLWGSKNGTDSGTNYCTNTTWPGDELTEKDENGWYTKSFECKSSDNSYNVIIYNNDTGSQSADCKGFTQLNLWVVIDDTASGVSLLFYDENPDDNPEATPIYEG